MSERSDDPCRARGGGVLYRARQRGVVHRERGFARSLARSLTLIGFDFVEARLIHHGVYIYARGGFFFLPASDVGGLVGTVCSRSTRYTRGGVHTVQTFILVKRLETAWSEEYRLE